MPTSWIYRLTTAGGEGKRLLRLSYGTQLPVVSTSTSDVVVSLLDGRRGLLPRADVALEASGNHPAASPRLILAEARKFLGLGYLWGGTSGFGFDCSGFSYAVFRTFGISLARDADDQALGGRSVSISRLQRGDLVFFRSQPGGDITHVGIAVGHGRMIDAPHTGVGIRIESITGFGGYAGARRYLPS